MATNKKRRSNDVQELSLRPYPGDMLVAYTKQAYERTHQRIFKTSDVLTAGQIGRCSWGEKADGFSIYVIWADDFHGMAHEVSHAILHMFNKCDIDPREASGEPFCYMLSQLLLEITTHKKTWEQTQKETQEH